MPRSRPLPTIQFLIALQLALCGCQSGGTVGTDQPILEGDQAMAIWPYWPTGMRIHPLSRIAIDLDGSTVIEARVEFTDRDAVTARALGFMRLRLYHRDNEIAAPIREWAVDLRSLDVNALRFDPVTRTYLIKLEIKPEELPAHGVLEVELQDPQGRQFIETAELRSVEAEEPPAG
ncbi:MAG: hypothetical protein ACYTGR_10590 [Planctomycetota bacterium]|jgi:hypothetical protein